MQRLRLWCRLLHSYAVFTVPRVWCFNTPQTLGAHATPTSYTPGVFSLDEFATYSNMHSESNPPPFDPQPPVGHKPAEPVKAAEPTLEPTIVEWLAFSLLVDQERDEGRLDAARDAWQADLDAARDAWQADLERRKAFRDSARGLSKLLEVAGLRVRPSNSALLAKQLEWLKTVPPRPAYDDEELG